MRVHPLPTMQTIHAPRDMQETALRLRREGRRVALVPTMGSLHEAHLSLMRIAREQADVCVVSIFVNPAQFGPGEDFERYPRDLERDAAACREASMDVVFAPSTEAMRMEKARVYVADDTVSHTLEGQFRPGHFRGVLTVVAKLFHLTLPDVAVFGRKDAQQLFLVEKMVRDLNFPVEIVPGPIIREPDGLAMSSRNVYLSEPERRDALCLHRALKAARELYARGQEDARAVKEEMAGIIHNTPAAKLDYAEIVSERTFTPVERLDAQCRAVVAARVGAARLIDNAALSDQEI